MNGLNYENKIAASLYFDKQTSDGDTPGEEKDFATWGVLLDSNSQVNTVHPWHERICDKEVRRS